MLAERQLDLHPVLVVDDSADDFEAMQRAFRKNNFTCRVEHVGTGEEALDYLKTKLRPSLILLDLNMPGMGGRKTLEMIKRDESLKSIPVVVLTTSNHDLDVNMCYSLGANTFIRKPVDFDVFTKTVKYLKEYWLDLAILPNPQTTAH